MSDQIRAQLDEALRALAVERDYADLLTKRVHERDAEIADLKRTSKSEVPNDYIKRLLTTEKELAALRAQVAGQRDGEFQEIVTLRNQLANALDSLKYECDQRRQAEQELAAIASAFAPYLKEGETPIERLARERHDSDILMTLLAKEKAHVEMVERVEARRVAARDKEIADLQCERSLADKERDAARMDRDRFQRERDEARLRAEQAEAERDAARAILSELALCGAEGDPEDRFQVWVTIPKTLWDRVQEAGQ